MQKTEDYRGSCLEVYTSPLSTGRVSYVVYIDGVHYLSTINGSDETNAVELGLVAGRIAVDDRLGGPAAD